MPLILAVAALVLVAGFLLIHFGLLPPPHAHTLVRFQGGQLQLKRGQLRGLARDQVRVLLEEAGVSKGYLAITSSPRVYFSRTIPSTYHQRLRNVVLNS